MTSISHKFGKVAVSFVIFVTAMTFASVVSADPVTVTGGSIQLTRSGASSFSMFGAGLSATGTTAPLNPLVSLFANGIISPGGTGQTGGSLDSQDSELFLASPITVDGVSYSPFSTILQLQLSSANFTAPVVPSSGFIVIAPFTLTAGLIEGYPGLPGQDNPLFSHNLTGSGITTLTFLLTPSGQYQLQSQSLTFGPTVAGVTVQSIPEPASVLLLLSSFAGLARFRRRRS